MVREANLKCLVQLIPKEFDKWWKENEAAWQERWQKAVDARAKSSTSTR